MSDVLWVFGYGSLVWRPAFPHVDRQPGSIEGWTRRFWQGSTDHRGVPGSPGRVVTVMPEPGARCWGMAYRVAPAEVAGVLAQLDVREKGGYERHRVVVTLTDGVGIDDALMYVATPANQNYLGPASLESIAAQVRASHGPSGANLDYVRCLAKALREIGAEDPHVFALDRILVGD